MPPSSYCTMGPQCRARVLFVRLDSGKAMPVDPDPDPDGNVAVCRDVTGKYVGRVLKANEEPDRWERRYLTHFASCAAYKAKQQHAAAVKHANAVHPNVVNLADRRGRR